jgi:hypothetical protein
MRTKDMVVSLRHQLDGANTLSNYQNLPEMGFVRLPAILAPHGPIPVSKSTWWQGVKDGRFPKPVG